MYDELKEIPIISYIIVISLSLLGSILHFLDTYKKDANRSYLCLICLLIIDIVSNISLSITIFIGALGLGLNELVAVALASLVARQGIQLVYLVEKIIVNRLK